MVYVYAEMYIHMSIEHLGKGVVFDLNHLLSTMHIQFFPTINLSLGLKGEPGYKQWDMKSHNRNHELKIFTVIVPYSQALYQNKIGRQCFHSSYINALLNICVGNVCASTESCIVNAQ